MLTISDEEKREAKSRKEEERLKRIAEKRSGDENKDVSMPQAQPGISSEDERFAVSELAISEPTPNLDAVSLEEPNELAPKILPTEADTIDQGSPNDPPVEEPPSSVTNKANEADAVSEVDPTLLDPALREPAIDELSTPEKNDGEIHKSGLSHAELVAARVLSAPSINDVPIEEATKAVRDAINVHEDSVADPSHPSEAIVHGESTVPRDVISGPSQASETSNGLETDVPPSLLPDPSHLAKSAAPGDSTMHQGLASDPSHASEATNTDPKSPKGESRVTTWLKSKFGRRTNKSHEPQIENSNQDLVGLKDEERHKEELRRTSQSISSISSDEDARENVPVLGQRKLSSHEDFTEAHDDLSRGKDPGEGVTSGASKDVGHIHESHVRDSKFQENL